MVPLSWIKLLDIRILVQSMAARKHAVLEFWEMIIIILHKQNFLPHCWELMAAYHGRPYSCVVWLCVFCWWVPPAWCSASLFRISTNRIKISQKWLVPLCDIYIELCGLIYAIKYMQDLIQVSASWWPLQTKVLLQSRTQGMSGWRNVSLLNSLAPGRYDCNLKLFVFKLISRTYIWSISGGLVSSGRGPLPGPILT